MKLVQTKGRNTAVKPTTNGAAKPAVPDAPVVYDAEQYAARSKQWKLNEFAEVIDANPESGFIILPVSSAEHSALELGAIYRGEVLEDWVKGWGLTAAQEVMDEIAYGLRDKKLKVVKVN